MNHKRRQMIKKALFILGIVLVAYLVLVVFPLFSSMYGFSGITRESLIVTGIFMLVWLLILFCAVKVKSRLLFNLHIGYWWVVMVAFIFTFVLRFNFIMDMMFVIIAGFIGSGYYIKAKTLNGEIS